MRRLDSEHAWIFDRWISPQTIVFSIVFFNHTKNLKPVLFFFTDGKKTNGAHTRSVRPMKTVLRSVFIRQTDRVYRALDIYFSIQWWKACLELHTHDGNPFHLCDGN